MSAQCSICTRCVIHYPLCCLYRDTFKIDNYSPVFKQNTIRDVVYAKNQFEPVTRKMVVRENGKYVTLNQTVLQYYVAHPEKVSSDAKAAAAAAINGTRYNPGSGNMNQLFFMTPTALTQQMGKSWMKGKTIADKFVLKGHAFFNVL